MLKGKNILIGITGAIAAYKIIELIRLLKKNNANVKVVVTPNALNFVTKTTLESLSQNSVDIKQFEIEDYKPEHIALTEEADIFLIAPASANTISKMANGICDNLLTSTFCAFKKQVIIAPSMNTGMWENPAVQKNIEFLRTHPSVGILGPTIKDLSGQDQNPRKQMSAKSQLIYWYFDLMWFHMKFNQWNLDKNAHSKETFWVSGSFMFVRNKAFSECGGFDEHTFLYGEEIILSSRMRQKKYITYYLKQTPIVHAHQGGIKSTFKSRRQNHNSIKYYYKKYENTPQYILWLSDFSFYLVEFISYLRHRI